jgi:hypothetical protein
MSDPNNPPPPPGYGQQPGQPAGQQPSYGSGQPGYGPPAGASSGDFPGKTLGIVGLVLSFFTTIIGLVISIVALRQSKKAGFKNTPALIGVIIGIVTTVLALIFGAIAVAGLIALLSQCAQLGPGVHTVNGVTVTCG